jgi:SNF2 family DNA or RNA helicase
MYRLIRKKLAESISSIKQTDDFEWKKWLKVPALDEEEIESFQTSLVDTNHLNNWLTEPTHEKKEVFLSQVEIFPELKDYSSKKTRINLIFFGLGSPEINKFKLSAFEAKYKRKPPEVKFREKPVKVKNIECTISNTVIENQNWELKTETIEVDLLNAEELKYFGSKNVEFNTAPPAIYKVKILSLDNIKLAKIYFLKNITLKPTKPLGEKYSVLKDPLVVEQDVNLLGMLPEEIVYEDIEAEIIPDEEVLSVEEIYVETEVVPDVSVETNELETSKDEKVSESEEEPEEEEDNNYVNVFESLYGFQEKGAEYLLKHKKALLNDELGLGKTVQAVSALKNLFGNGRIKSALVICSSEELGSIGSTECTDGWIGHLHSRAPDLKVVHLNGSLKERKKKWKNAFDVLISTYKNFFLDVEEKVVAPTELKQFDCLIIDEIQFYFEKKFDSEKLLKSINPKYIWALSSMSIGDLGKDLNSVSKNKFSIKNYIGRSKKDVIKEIPNVVWQEKWLDMDDEQAAEYNDAFISVKEKVSWLMESGNPLRFNANIFTILHQLKQICNFSENKKKSAKTELLIKQVELIAGNNKKVIIFSQYDKTTKKIEEILKNDKIEYVSYAPGMSTKAMQSTIKDFTSKPSVTAMIAGVKPGRMKITSGEIPYVIHFDQWWNPASVWQTAETIGSSSKSTFLNENLNIYSYLMKGTIEEKIKDLLLRKGFLNKNIMENVSADSIAAMIANEEWLEVFDMLDDGFKNKQESVIQELEGQIGEDSPEELIEIGKKLFTKLGYRNLDILKNTEKNYFDIRGIVKKVNYDLQMNARFLFEDPLGKEEIKKHIVDLKERTNNGRMFLIVKNIFDEPQLSIHNTSLLDFKLLSNYLYQFRVV